MLVLTRRIGESLVIGDSVVVTVVRVTPYAVRIGIEAPREMSVVRPDIGRIEFDLPLDASSESPDSPDHAQREL